VTKPTSPSETRRPKSLSPDVLEVLHMLSALENQPRRPQEQTSGE
jgi:hypothetical protein